MPSSPTPAPIKTEANFDMENFFDFNQGTTQPSPATASSSKMDMMTSYDKEETQQFHGPSHDYGQFKQQVGLPVGSMAGMAGMGQVNPASNVYDGYNSGINEMDFSQPGFGWNSGAEMDAEMSIDFNNPQSTPFAFAQPSEHTINNFVNPSSLGGHDEPTSNVGRLWPGMHSMQAQQMASAKAAHMQAAQQRHRSMQAQQAQFRQPANSNHASRSHSISQSSQSGTKPIAQMSEPHVEESISRLLNQMRQNSSASSDAGSPSGSMLPHIARMKKDEEEMDEDERLLASEEGKKLSSKERRQLRNKVSARAFRSRRKEYITQLEGEVALKAQEAQNVRTENQALMHENERYRCLIETLLRHPAFVPFLNDLSKDPAVLGLPAQQPLAQLQQQHQRQQQQQREQHLKQQQQPSQKPSQQQSAPVQPQQPQQDPKQELMNFDASQLQVPQQQSENLHVGITMVPDDFSKLNINGARGIPNFNGNFSVNAYAVTDLPAGPNPADLLRTPSDFTRNTSSLTGESSMCFPSADVKLNLLLSKLDSAARNI